MARPIKKGLSYFNIDVNMDANMEYLEAMHGIESFAVVIKLWQRIYGGEGYYMEWNERVKLIFCKQNGIDRNKVQEILDTCFECEIFNQQKYLEKNVLTSKGIQKRYAKIVKEAKRKGCNILPEYDLITLITEETVVNSELTTVSSEVFQNEQGRNPEESTQSKVKKSKVKEIISCSNSAREEISDLPKSKKNGIPPNSAAPPLEKPDFKKELENDQVFIEQTCMVYKLTKAQFWEKHLFFVAQCLALEKLNHEDYGKFKNHFFYWIPKNKNGQSPPKKRKAVAVSLDSKIIDSSKYDKYKS